MMTVKYQIVFWRDIPAQIKVKDGRKRGGRPLSDRFTVAIDEAAMRAGLINSEDYLAEWRNGDWVEQDGEMDEVIDALAGELEAAYPPDRLRALIRQHGFQQDAE
jgi:hypothetical protein